MNTSVVLGPKEQRFHAAVARVRKYEKDALIGMCSNAEIERLEKLALEVEEKAKVSQSNEHMARSNSILNGLWRRYQETRNEVLKWQEELGPHRMVLTILGTPLGYFEQPEAISSVAPSFGTATECETFTTAFGHKVMDIETKARHIRECCQEWTRLSLEQQNRKLIMALAERL